MGTSAEISADKVHGLAGFVDGAFPTLGGAEQIGHITGQGTHGLEPVEE